MLLKHGHVRERKEDTILFLIPFSCCASVKLCCSTPFMNCAWCSRLTSFSDGMVVYAILPEFSNPFHQNE